MRKTPLLAALVLLASSVARADTVEVSSTTFLSVGQQTKYSGGAKPDLETVAPVFEVLSINARDIQYPFASDVRFVVSGWGAVELMENRRWDAGTDSDAFSGDLNLGYAEGRLFHRYVTLRLGRQLVTTGNARMLQLDGGEVMVALPLGGTEVKLDGWVGAPTAQRFSSRTSVNNWNPTVGDLAYGGRLGVAIPMVGLAGRGVELGASANMVQNGSDTVRQEVGGDIRLQPAAAKNLVLAGNGTWSLYDQRLAEANAAATWTTTPRLHLTADYKYVEPSLLLSRNSILSVFSTSTWTEVGGGFRYDLTKNVKAGADYHARIEPGATSGTHTGHDALAVLDWNRGPTTAGAELTYLTGVVNGYSGLRLYVRRDLAKSGAFVTADVMGQYFEKTVNGENGAITGNLAVSVPLAHGFAAVVSGQAGVNPYMEQTYNVMAKLAYNQTYRSTEVR